MLAPQEVFFCPCQLSSVKPSTKRLDTAELAGSTPPPSDPVTLMTLPPTSQFFTCSKSLPKRLDIEGLFCATLFSCDWCMNTYYLNFCYLPYQEIYLKGERRTSTESCNSFPSSSENPLDGITYGLFAGIGTGSNLCRGIRRLCCAPV